MLTLLIIILLPPNYNLEFNLVIYLLHACALLGYALADMQGIPLPQTTNNNDASIRPLSKEAMDMLDPTAYMSLWELQSSQEKVTAGIK